MESIWVRAAGLDGMLAFRMEPNSALLLGRNPDAGKLSPTLLPQLGGDRIRCERIPSPRVSANHVLIWHTGTTLRLWDLTSRNGTAMQLRPQQQVEVSRELLLTLELAQPKNATAIEQAPRAAEWQNDREFASAVAEAIRSWLDVIELAGQVSVSWPVDAAPDLPDGLPMGRFALADGAELRVSASDAATHPLSWSSVLDKVHVYINEQNGRLELLQGHEEGFILASSALREAHRQVADAASRGTRLLLLGPTGAGKERLASCYHRHSRQHRGPFTTINCSLLSQDLIYAQLFGAKKGSFTGCTADITGVVEAAHEGTLFLDEVAEMNLDVQRALLRFLDTQGEYQRLGDARTRRAHVQIVCATNAALDEPEQRRGHFRDDLWYRLAVRVVRVPPLRERREDIIAYLQSRRMPGGSSAYEALTPAALQLVLDDVWPGNFRDLENFVERLPAAPSPRSVDEQTCAAALEEGRGTNAAGRKVPPIMAQLPETTDGSWAEIAAQAAAAFAKDYGLRPGLWGQIPIFTEKYLKPVFLAQACGLSHIDEVSKTLNLSELARRMNIADGTTIKLQLQRYIDRFRRRGQPEE